VSHLFENIYKSLTNDFDCTANVLMFADQSFELEMKQVFMRCRRRTKLELFPNFRGAYRVKFLVYVLSETHKFPSDV